MGHIEIKKRQTDKPSTSVFWWALQDLNLRPLPCQRFLMRFPPCSHRA